MRSDVELTYVRTGTFSGSAISLRRALASSVSLRDIDLIRFARRPSLLLARIAGLVEASTARGGSVPFSKTAAWSIGMQQCVRREDAITNERPILFIQTLPAFVLDPDVKYWIYTDRVSREGAAVGGKHASTFSRRWLAREEVFLRRAQRVYVMGPSTEDVLVREYGLARSTISVVGAGPNAPLGPPAHSQACHTMMFVGTQWELKGGPELLTAFSTLRAEFPGLRLLLVGSEPKGPLPPGAESVGRVAHSRMDDLYSQADALVIPTHMEAFGISLLEGLLKGLPCICTTIGNQPWIVGDAGKHVEPGAVDQLTAAMRKLISNYLHYRERAEERGRYLRERFQWEKVAAAILQDVLP